VFWGFHGGEDSSRGLLGCDAVRCCGRIPTFRRSMLPPLHPVIVYTERFEAFTTVKIQVDVFYVVTPWSVVVGYRRFGGPCCLHFTLLHWIMWRLFHVSILLCSILYHSEQVKCCLATTEQQWNVCQSRNRITELLQYEALVTEGHLEVVLHDRYMKRWMFYYSFMDRHAYHPHEIQKWESRWMKAGRELW
jgi:hypothetical protein